MRQKYLLHICTLFVFVFLFLTESKAQDTCRCKSYPTNEDTVLQDFPAVVHFQTFKTQHISVCGQANKFSETSEGYFYVEVLDCSIGHVISDFAEEDIYKIVAVKDTLSLYYRDQLITVKGSLDLVYGYPFRTVYYEQDSVIKHTKKWASAFKPYNRKQLKKLRKKYLAFNVKKLPPETVDQELQTFVYQLAIGAISGDNEAENRLHNFTDFYGELEQYSVTIGLGRKALNMMRKVEPFKK